MHEDKFPPATISRSPQNIELKERLKHVEEQIKERVSQAPPALPLRNAALAHCDELLSLLDRALGEDGYAVEELFQAIYAKHKAFRLKQDGVIITKTKPPSLDKAPASLDKAQPVDDQIRQWVEEVLQSTLRCERLTARGVQQVTAALINPIVVLRMLARCINQPAFRAAIACLLVDEARYWQVDPPAPEDERSRDAVQDMGTARRVAAEVLDGRARVMEDTRGHSLASK